MIGFQFHKSTKFRLIIHKLEFTSHKLDDTVLSAYWDIFESNISFMASPQDNTLFLGEFYFYAHVVCCWGFFGWNALQNYIGVFSRCGCGWLG